VIGVDQRARELTDDMVGAVLVAGDDKARDATH
jgi:hypothetical protein